MVPAKAFQRRLHSGPQAEKTPHVNGSSTWWRLVPVAFVGSVAAGLCGAGVLHAKRQEDEKTAEWYRGAEAWYRGVAALYRDAADLADSDMEMVDSDVQYMMGRMRHEGLGGVVQSHKRAMKWYKRAAAQGHQQAQYMVGWMYEHGEGVLPNADKARKFYKMAADQDNENALFALGRMHRQTVCDRRDDNKHGALTGVFLGVHTGTGTSPEGVGTSPETGSAGAET